MINKTLYLGIEKFERKRDKLNVNVNNADRLRCTYQRLLTFDGESVEKVFLTLGI